MNNAYRNALGADLKPGDTLLLFAASGGYLRVLLSEVERTEEGRIMRAALIGQRPQNGANLEEITDLVVPNGRSYGIISSGDLTPAQQHADELVAVLRLTILGRAAGIIREAAATVLAKIDPPKPVTLEEALELAYRLGAGSEALAVAVKPLLDRARAAGQLS